MCSDAGLVVLCDVIGLNVVYGMLWGVWDDGGGDC